MKYLKLFENYSIEVDEDAIDDIPMMLEIYREELGEISAKLEKESLGSYYFVNEPEVQEMYKLIVDRIKDVKDVKEKFLSLPSVNMLVVRRLDKVIGHAGLLQSAIREYRYSLERAIKYDIIEDRDFQKSYKVVQLKFQIMKRTFTLKFDT